MKEETISRYEGGRAKGCWGGVGKFRCGSHCRFTERGFLVQRCHLRKHFVLVHDTDRWGHRFASDAFYFFYAVVDYRSQFVYLGFRWEQLCYQCIVTDGIVFFGLSSSSFVSVCRYTTFHPGASLAVIRCCWYREKDRMWRSVWRSAMYLRVTTLLIGLLASAMYTMDAASLTFLTFQCGSVSLCVGGGLSLLCRICHSCMGRRRCSSWCARLVSVVAGGRGGDPLDCKLYRKSVRNISRYETSLHRKKIGGIHKRERSIGVTLSVGSFAAI